MFHLRNWLLYAALSILFVVGISIQSYTQAMTVGSAERTDTPSAQGTGYWAALMWYPQEGHVTPYAASNVFRARGCPSYATENGEVLKYVKSKIEMPYPQMLVLICNWTYEETANKLRLPAEFQLRTRWTIPDMDGGGSSNSDSGAGSTDNGSDSSSQSSSNTTTDVDSRTDERTRLFNQQNGRTTAVNPDGTQSTKLVRRDGESEEDFRARERAALYNAQKNSKIAPDGSVESAWTEADAKKYTQGKRGHWAVGSFKASAWCADKMSITTRYVDACVVDSKGEGAFKGTFLQVRNSSLEYPVYYGLSGVLNKKAAPGQTVTEDLHMYLPIDSTKRGQTPDTVVEILVKYWVEDN
jgi:hypothetical protein